MRRFAPAALCLALVLSACGSGAAEPPAASVPAEPSSIQSAAPEPEAWSADLEEGTEQNGTLVVYFSRVGNTDFPEDISAVSSASLSRPEGELKGNAQLMAEWMADEAGAALFEIQTEHTYPADYNETTDAAKREQNENARPALRTAIEGFDSCSDFYLVFPNWWADLPMALYSFFEEYDFSGKTIYVSVTHEGSGFSRTLSTIRSLEPEAEVIEGLSIRGAAVPESEAAVRQFVRENS